MGDDVSLNASSGTFLAAADERSLGGSTVKVQRVVGIGSTANATSQVTPTTTAATLVAARETRARVVLTNFGSVDCWIGPATVTATGVPNLPVGFSFVSYSTALIQAILASGTTMTGAVTVWEEFD